MTADQLWRMPEDGQRHELIRGELRTMAPAGSEHGMIGGNLLGPLIHHVKSNRLGIVMLAETGFIIARNPDTVRAPDIAYIAQSRIPANGVTDRFFPGAPDLAVEVISPSDTVNELEEKVQHWLDAGTRLVWVVSPKQRTVTVHRPGQQPIILRHTDTLDGQDVVPGFTLLVSEVFAVPGQT
jgi:Uma2 family endonuclease